MKKSTAEWIYKRTIILAVLTGLVLAGLFSIVIKHILDSLELTAAVQNELWLIVSFFGLIVIIIVFSIGFLIIDEIKHLLYEKKLDPIQNNHTSLSNKNRKR